MSKYFTLLLGALVMWFNAPAQSIAGAWSGEIDVAGNKLELIFYFTQNDSDSLECILAVPAQNAKIPAQIDYLAEDSACVNMPVIGAAFAGKIADKNIAGVFSQRGMNFELTLVPYAPQANRPQEPQPPFGYATEEVSFTNKNDNAVLSGTLTYPLNYKKGDKVPVILMVTGSGAQNRDEEIFNHKPFLVIADYLAKNGIASLRYDDRGFGKSTGNTNDITTEVNRDDAMAGLEFLRSRGEFGKIGLLGHSEGGTIGFMIAGNYPQMLDFIISMAGVSLPGKAVLLEQNRHFLEMSGLDKQTCDSYSLVLDVLFDRMANPDLVAGPDSINSRAFIDSLVKVNNVNIPHTMIESLVEASNIKNKWLSYFISYNPAQDIEKISVPVMAINGSNDMQVNAKANLLELEKLLKKSSYNLIKEYDGLNHLFQHCTTGEVSEYAQIEETISAQVLEDIADWIKSLK